ncbi:NAD(P)-dependent oxidoreductase [Microbacterium sp. 10M-3C3]|uniref:DUF1932 domain-containing protein n=1 Tax=Microbacterium sp. 10M-3C3 TaxID=2483401 RepID=UPI000F63A89B|nr:NAD(P)-dependent oxidoreductase [Microbacterium sp. 10M-3C3]
MTRVAVIGLGEAGSRYATGLAAAGAEVRGFDPAHRLEHPGVAERATLADAVADADVVLSLVHARVAIDVAAAALPHMHNGVVYADLNTAAAEVKAAVADVAARRGVAMADVGVLAPVPRAGHRTPLIASGTGAAAFAARLAPFGVPVDVLDAPAGEAARLRLLRSAFMKGLAALVMEGLDAARPAGAEAWLRTQMARELGPDGEALLDRLVTGTARHAARRADEMAAVVDALEAAGTPADMARATLARLERTHRAGSEGQRR